MTIALDLAARILVGSAFQDMVNQVEQVTQRLGAVLTGVTAPSEITDFVASAIQLRDRMPPGDDLAAIEFTFTDEELRLLRAAVALKRRATAERVERSQQHLISQSLSRALDQTLGPLDQLLAHSALRSVVPRKTPTLADFVTAEGRQGQDFVPTLQAEEREQKHRILLASSLIVKDLPTFRRQCEDRGLPLAVVFADLDDFKTFNSELGEVAVDRQILPRIMSAVESASYGHGRAYRYGGDEFVMLLPNANLPVIESLVRQVKNAVEKLVFDGVDLQPRMSAGVWITAPSSHLTAEELIDRASQAKKASKEAGKSRITIRVEIGSEYVETIIE